MVNQSITAHDVEFYIGEVRVGGAEEMSVEITAENARRYEAGSYWPVEIVDGKRAVTGTITKAYLDNELIATLIPQGRSELQTAFTVTGNTVTGKTPSRKITVFGAKFNSVNISDLSLSSEGAKNALAFEGTGYDLPVE
jgi:hypothetical protein